MQTIARLVLLGRTQSRHILCAPRYFTNLRQTRTIFSEARLYSTTTSAAETAETEATLNDVEKAHGVQTRLEFQAETQKLLDIVAKSLYSDREVFIRELVSNASDAIERLRFRQVSQSSSPIIGATSASGTETDSSSSPWEIHLKTDDTKRLLIIQDSGIGMTKQEMQDNLGTIARSGSREFVSTSSEKNDLSSSSNIIGQFGVGFYACFMVADKVEVYSRPHTESIGHIWTSTGHDAHFELGEAENVSPGTKIVLHLKESAAEFSRDEKVEKILKKYSNFVGAPLFLNSKRINVVEPLWLKDPASINEAEHIAFYQFMANTYDIPRFTFTYKTDAPINLRVLLYVPNFKPSLLEIARETDAGISLYSRKVLILNRTDALLPKWLRFLKGVVDSEDIPLNLSRELLQDNALINRIKRIITGRIIKFFSQQALKDPVSFQSFLNAFGLYLKEGLITEEDQSLREQIASLLRWESSGLPEGQQTSLTEYSSRMPAGSRTIYFLSAPNRQLAESSPYLEAAKKQSSNTEVLFLYEAHDELVLMQLGQYDKKSLKSVESLVAEDAADTDSVGAERDNCLTQDQASHLVDWAQTYLGPRVKKVKMTQRLSSHPCFVSIREAGAMRHFLRTTLADRPAEERFRIMEPILELNPDHQLIRYLSQVVASDTNHDLAHQLTDHLFDSALAQAGLMDDVRGLASRATDLLSKLSEKGQNQ